MKPNAEDYPIQICGIAWRELKKGQIIDAEKVEEMYFLLSTKGFNYFCIIFSNNFETEFKMLTGL